MLKQVSKRLLDVVSKNETVYRTDGDQFIVCLGDYEDEENLDLIISKIIKVFNTPFILNGEEYVVTASMGVSQYPTDGEDVEVLIESAYIAMGKAKNMGSNQYLKYSKKLKKETFETLLLTNDLYYAIKRNQLDLAYQPQVNGATGEIIGVEALLR